MACTPSLKGCQGFCSEGSPPQGPERPLPFTIWVGSLNTSSRAVASLSRSWGGLTGRSCARHGDSTSSAPSSRSRGSQLTSSGASLTSMASRADSTRSGPRTSRAARGPSATGSSPTPTRAPRRATPGSWDAIVAAVRTAASAGPPLPPGCNLDAQAAGAGQRRVCLRTATYAGRIYIDLCDDAWRVVEVDSEGWRVLSERPEVRFMRPKTARPLPERGEGGARKGLVPCGASSTSATEISCSVSPGSWPP